MLKLSNGEEQFKCVALTNTQPQVTRTDPNVCSNVSSHKTLVIYTLQSAFFTPL